MRQIVLDTETTGINPKLGNRIEIGCVELVNRMLTGNISTSTSIPNAIRKRAR
jgi:DNA polymerase III epsilon subunit-like protein